MKIKLIQVGKTENDYLEKGINEFKRRLEHYTIVEETTVKCPVNAAKQGILVQKKTEAKLILEQFSQGDSVFLLDEKGREYSSLEFADFLRKMNNQSIKQLVFCIGGPYGFGEEINTAIKGRISFSKMTFSHQMIRLFFWEQLYRAHTIIKGEKYHNT